MRSEVAGRTVSDGRVLAIRREDDGRWVPPGGVVELDETPEHAALVRVHDGTHLL
jgi:ADP-ribose pyrophosphatase YjhB (NUDIX family)